MVKHVVFKFSIDPSIAQLQNIIGEGPNPDQTGNLKILNKL